MGQDRSAVETPEPTRKGRLRLPRIRTFDSLASKDFRLLWAGSFFDNMAVWLQLLSLTSLVYDLTGSALYAGIAGGLRGLPTLIIGPWAGVAADRMNRKMLVLVSQVLLTVSAAVFVAVVFLGEVEVWHALVYAAFSSICFSFIMPIRQALVVNTAPPGNLGNAYALSAMTITVNRFIGGLLFAGLLLVTGDIKWNFVVEAVAYLVTALLLIPMQNALCRAVHRRSRLGFQQPDRGIEVHLDREPDHPAPDNSELHTDLGLPARSGAASPLRQQGARIGG